MGVGWGVIFFSETTNLNAESHPKSTPLETPRTMFGQISGSSWPSKVDTKKLSITLAYHKALGKQK